MSNATQRMLNNITNFEMSPALIEQEIYNLLEEGINDIDIVDPTNPFVFLLGVTAAGTYSHLVQSENTLRKMYPKLALTNRELFHHLSDQDYNGIYARPSTTNIKVLLNFDQILQNGYEPPGSQRREVLIPRDSFFAVAGYNLGIHFPILVTVFTASNAISVQYIVGTNENHPLQKLDTNLVTYRTIIISNARFIELTIPVEQFTIDTQYFNLDKTTSFTQKMMIPEKFMYARVWRMDGNIWKEMEVTHSNRNYDNSHPTMVMAVNGNELILSLPDIYQFLFSITTIRVDLYTTQGEIDFDLNNIPSVEYTMVWREICDKIDGYVSSKVYDTLGDTTYKDRISALQRISGNVVTSTEWIHGGANGLTFGQIKENVIYRNNSRTPIRFSDIVQSMKAYNYQVSKYIDNVTDKVYVATKPIPSYIKNGLERNAFAFLHNNIIDVSNNDPDMEYAIINNGTRCTVTPDTLFKLENGNMVIVAKSNVDIISQMDNVNKVKEINAYPYYYSPFFYVVDYTLTTLKCRAYRLNVPLVLSRTFIENGGSGSGQDFITGTKFTNLRLARDGNQYYYELELTITVPKTVPVGSTYECVLKIDPNGVDEDFYLSVVTEPVFGEQTFTFRLDTQVDIDQFNTVDIRHLNEDNDLITKRANITHLFGLKYTVTLPGILGSFHTVEEIEIEFGTLLEGLYIPSKTIVSDIVYQKYENPVPLTYAEDVYERDGNGKLIWTINEANETEFNIIHAAGSQVLDENNDPVWKHLAGDYILDVNGNYIVDNDDTSIQVVLGMVLLSATFRYATDITTIEYRDSVPESIIEFLDTEIIPMDRKLNEKVDILFKPKGTIGNIRVGIGNDLETVVDSNITYKVTIYITKSGYSNPDLLRKVTLNTKNILVKSVNERYLSVYDLALKIRNSSGPEIFNVDIEKFGPAKDISVMKLMDDSQSFSILDKLELLPGDQLDVVDAIDVHYAQIEL